MPESLLLDRAFSSHGQQGLLHVVCRLQGGGVSSCRAQVLESVRFRSCCSWAYVPLGMWDLPGPGMGARVSGTGRRILTHRTAREAQACTLDHPD